MRDYAGEAALQQSQLDVLEAQLALMEAREARLEVIDARAAEEEGNAGWRQAAIDMSDSVGDLTQQLQQRERDFLDLQVSNFVFIRLQVWGLSLTRLPRSAHTPSQLLIPLRCCLFRTSSCGRSRTRC